MHHTHTQRAAFKVNPDERIAEMELIYLLSREEREGLCLDLAKWSLS